MKTHSLAMVVASFWSAGALAQTAEPAPTAPPTVAVPAEDTRSHVLLVQPIPWALGIYGGTYEGALSDKWELAIGWNVSALVLSQNNNGNSSSTQLFGVGVQPGVSYFLVGRAPSGLWVGAKLELAYLQYQTGSTFTGSSPFSTTTNGFVYGGHAMVGYTYVFSSGFTLEGGVGIGGDGSSLSSSSTGGTSSPFSLTASLGRISLGAGWAF